MRELKRPENAFRLDLPLVRLGEFDMGGVLYHAHYFHLYEQAREALLSHGGCPYSALVSSDLHLAVIESSQIFTKPVYYGQVLYLYLWVDELRKTTVAFCYELAVVSPEGESSVHQAWTKHACLRRLSHGKFKPSRFPESVHRIFSTVLTTNSTDKEG